MFTFLLPIVVALPTAAGHPLCKDKTGLHWVIPFRDALASARATGHALMIKPVAFGTTADGGW